MTIKEVPHRLPPGDELVPATLAFYGTSHPESNWWDPVVEFLEQTIPPRNEILTYLPFKGDTSTWDPEYDEVMARSQMAEAGVVIVCITAKLDGSLSAKGLIDLDDIASVREKRGKLGSLAVLLDVDSYSDGSHARKVLLDQKKKLEAKYGPQGITFARDLGDLALTAGRLMGFEDHMDTKLSQAKAQEITDRYVPPNKRLPKQLSPGDSSRAEDLVERRAKIVLSPVLRRLARAIDRSPEAPYWTAKLSARARSASLTNRISGLPSFGEIDLDTRQRMVDEKFGEWFSIRAPWRDTIVLVRSGYDFDDDHPDKSRLSLKQANPLERMWHVLRGSSPY
jgi:hypothetical protein